MSFLKAATMIGIRLEFERETPEFYLLAFTGDSELRPLMQDGKILLMTNKRHTRMVAALAGCEQAVATARKEDEVWFSVGRAVTVLREEPVDHWALILNTINLLDDLLIAVAVSPPPVHKAHLDQLADYLTFDRDLDAFFTTATFDRAEACNALLWCIGALFTRVRILPHIMRTSTPT